MEEGERRVTIYEYTTAFFTWSAVAHLPEKLTAILGKGMLHLLNTFKDSEAREPEEYCKVLREWAQVAARSHKGDELWIGDHGDFGELHLRIEKSCLLDRLIYLGETVRTVPCPLHKGKWSGIHAERCPHGCDIGCGCTTGWLPVNPAGA